MICIGRSKHTSSHQYWLDTCDAVLEWWIEGDYLIFAYDPGVYVDYAPGIEFEEKTQ